jgi:predicted 2-oxoglutarate/Fe(II)-dependent dioxygenase YbiX
MYESQVNKVDISAYNGAFLIDIPSIFMDVECFNRDQCKKYVKEISNLSTQRSGVYNTSGVEDKKYIEEQKFRTSSFVQPSAQTYKEVEERINFVVDYHCRKFYPQLSIENSKEPIQFLKYDSINSGEFKMHTDNAFYNEHGKFIFTHPKRILTSVTYLNDDYEGGELVLGFMKDQNGNCQSFKPLPGTTIIFGSDIRYPHQVLPVREGIRYSIVKWYGSI